MKNFKSLGVNAKFIEALTELNIKSPTEIQEKAIPLLLAGKTDLVGQAQTGTGKTAAYGLPLLQQIDCKRNETQALVLCPTRELSKQVAKQLFRFTKYSDKIFTEAVYGGEHIDKQIVALQRPTHIIVATPGRLIDLINRKVVNLNAVKTIVLDEADEMLSMGFKKELDEILRHTKADSKWLFSATMPHGIADIIKSHMSADAHRIRVSDNRSVVNSKITHKYLTCLDEDKLFVLMQFLKTQGTSQGVIFCKTKEAAKLLSKQLIAKNLTADAIHGDLLQKERDKVMRAFKNKNLQLLVATDLAARGIDIEDLAFVIHYQLPESEEYYAHRSGRTARAGKEGLSLCLVHSKEVKKLKEYERKLGFTFIQVKPLK